VRTILAAGLLLALAAPPPARAQTLLQSDPPASWLRLEGVLSVSGTAPIDFGEVAAGRYRLLTRGATTEVARGYLRWDGARSLRLDGYAGPGSLLSPPGLGHLSRGEPRGWTYSLIALGGASGLVVTQIQHGRADDETGAARKRYLDAVSEPEVVNARIDYQLAARWKSDKEEMRAFWLGYTAYAWLGAGVDLWLLTPHPSLSSTGSGYAIALPGRSGVGAGLRSLLVPGAGQRALGHDRRGNRFLFLTAVTGAGALITHDVYLNQKRDQYEAQLRYDAAQTEDEARAQRAVLEREADDVNVWNAVQWTAIGVTGALWLWNVVDAVALSGKTPDAASGFGFRVFPSPGGMTATLAWRIG